VIGRRYGSSEWLEFLCDADPRVDGAELSAETVAMRDTFTRRIAEIAAEVAPDEDIDDDDTACLAFASLVGHGFGLWEYRLHWHGALQERILIGTALLRMAEDLEYAAMSDLGYFDPETEET